MRSRPTRVVDRSGRRGLGWAAIASCALSLGSPMVASAQGPLMQRSTVLENVRLISSDGRVIEGANVVIRGSDIAGVGTQAAPSGPMTRSTNLGGRFVTPGLIDPNGAIALTGGNADPDARARAADAFDHYDRLTVTDAWRNGVTGVFIPARGGIGVQGVGAVVRLVPREIGGFGEFVSDEAALCIDLGSRAGAIARAEAYAKIVADFRSAEAYREANEIYKEELEEYEKKVAERAKKDEAAGSGSGSGSGSGAAGRRPGGAQASGNGSGGDGENKEDELKKPARPDPNKGYDVLLRAIDRDMPVRIVAHRSADILNAIRLSEQFGLDLIVVGATDADLVADRLAEAKARVILDPVIGPGSARSPRRVHRMRDVASALTAAGVPWSVGTGAGSSEASRALLVAAAEVTDGSADAFTLATRRASEAVGQRQRLGTLRPGVPADLVVWSGHPLEPGSFVERVYMNGRVVFTSPRSELEGGR